uniref:Uncharacterized protein n=1 Tax=Romanomermis culicivorax TaxID=13658 RepID=A0A915L6R4_ROMCU
MFSNLGAMLNALLLEKSRNESTSDDDGFLKKGCPEIPIAHKINVSPVFKILYGVEDSILFEYRNEDHISLTSFDDLLQGAFTEILKPIFRTGNSVRNILKLLSVYSNIEPHQAATQWLRVYIKGFWANVDYTRRNHSHSIVDFIVNVKSLLDEIDVISVVFQSFFDQEIICRFNVRLFLNKLVCTLTTFERLGIREPREKLFDLFCICISSLLRKMDEVLDGLLDKQDTSAALLEMLEILPAVEKSIFFSSLRSNIESILSLLKIFVHLSDYDEMYRIPGPETRPEITSDGPGIRIREYPPNFWIRVRSGFADPNIFGSGSAAAKD